MSEAQKILDELHKTHQALTEHVDKQIDEVRKQGYSSSEVDAKIEKINSDLSEVRKQYDEAVKAANRPSMVPGVAGVSEDEIRSQKAFEKYIRYGVGEVGRAVMTDDEYRALSPASDAKGQFLVPSSWESQLITQAYNQSEIRPVAQAAPTGRDAVFMPALSKPVVAWGNANLEVTAQTLKAGGERLEIFDLRALILIHNNTLDDADADIWGELNMMGAQAVAEAEDLAFAVGTGYNSPLGIVADERVQANHIKTGVASALTDETHNGVDAIIDLFYSLKKTYRSRGTFAMNSTTEGAVRKLKDKDGQYLWQPPVQAGAPALLLGRPVINPEGLPDVAAGAFPIVFGDFSRGYKIRDRKGVSVQRLVERYAEFNQTGFMLTRRVGGQVTLPEAFVCLKVAAS